MKVVPKSWGKEMWIVNEEYCGKFIEIKDGKMCSMHCHPVKKETFYVLSGRVRLLVCREYLSNEGNREFMEEYHMHEGGPVVTINPGEYHQFMGITDSLMLEISTHHNDNDVNRRGNKLRK